jgi:hypothetical protein
MIANCSWCGSDDYQRPQRGTRWRGTPCDRVLGGLQAGFGRCQEFPRVAAALERYVWPWLPIGPARSVTSMERS